MVQWWDHQILNLLEKGHLVIPISSILGEILYLSKSPPSEPLLNMVIPCPLAIHTVDTYIIYQGTLHRCNPNVGLHTTAGQLVKNRYNTGLASPLTMELLSDQPVGQQWVQYRSGQSMYNKYDKWLASPFTMDTIKWPASQFKTGNWQRLY